MVALGARQTQLETVIAERDQAICLAEAREAARIRIVFVATR
jgi:hypothetical protein